MRHLTPCFFLVAILGIVSRAQSYEINFQLPSPGKVSVAIYDAQGRMVRELSHAVPMKPGSHTLIWDALDRDGNSLPTGAYVWKLLQTNGLKAKYLMSIGSNYPPGTDWRTACGPGTHGAPYGIAVDATGIYVAANTTENIETCALKMTPDGSSRLWSALHPKPWDGALSLAIDGGELFMLGHTAATDGRITLPPHQLIYVYDAATGNLASRTVKATGIGQVPDRIDVHWDPATNDVDASDMDVYEGVLVVAYAKRDALRWYDPQSGERLGSVEIDAPQGVTVGTQGIVYVTTGDRVVRLSREDKQPVEVVRGLERPGRLDLDHSTGDLLIYLNGSQQIARYSPSGSLRKTYGEPGGRADGLYNDQTKRSFAGFADLCADHDGSFYVTESDSAPRRTAHLAVDGSVIREWYGGQRWAPHAAIEGDDPRVLWVGSQYGWIMRVLVDYERKSWTVHSCYQYKDLAEGLVGDSFNEGGFFRVLRHNGTTYLVLEKLPTILKVDEQEWKLRPVTVCGSTWNAQSPIKSWAGSNGSFQWNDANGDGLPQQDECTFYESGIASDFVPTIGTDFTCWTVRGDESGRRVHRFPVTRWTEVGAPVYGTLPQGEVFGLCTSRFNPEHFADSRWSAFLFHDAASGSLYAALNDWARNWCDYDDSFLQKWSADGTSPWTVGQRADGKALPGEIKSHLRGLAGVAHDCVVAIDVDGGWNLANLAVSYVWDRDGLYVGGLMDAPDLDGVEKHWYQCGGEFCHATVATLPDGNVLFFGNWENEMRIYRISGWEGWQRQSGTVRLAEPAPAHTGQGLTLTTFEDDALTRPRSVTLAPGIEFSRNGEKPAPHGLRWTGTLLPEYGPAYSGPWSVRSDTACFGGACRGSRDDDASVTFRFRGSSVSIVGVTGPNGGFAHVSLDGEEQSQVDCYSADVGHDVTLFSRDHLNAGDHEVTLKVAGWRQPRNKESSDSWVLLDKLVVDGLEHDDAGLDHSFTANADGRLQLWLDHTLVLGELAAQSTRDVPGIQPIKLLRRPISIQLDYSGVGSDGNLTLGWSTPFHALRPIQTSQIYPAVPGGYTMQNLRYVVDLEPTSVESTSR